jgi:hypothetical protein
MEVEEIVEQIYLKRHPEEKYFRNFLDKSIKKYHPLYKRLICYVIDDKVYMVYNTASNTIHIKDDLMINQYNSKFDLNHIQIIELLKTYITKYMKLEDFEIRIMENCFYIEDLIRRRGIIYNSE